ncbi:MAG: glycosyltransferase [Planctomycetaceae bacterium]
MFPADTGGKIRTLNIVRELARSHAITYLCNVQEGEQPAVAQMAALGLQVETVPWRETSRESWRFYAELAGNMLSPLPYNAAKDADVRLRQRAEELLSRHVYDLVICDFVQMAANAIGLEGPPKVLFQHNVEAEIFERHAQHDQGALRRRFMAYQASKMRRFEGQAGRAFDTVIAVSDRDRRQFIERYGWRHVQTIDTAVDVDFFQPDGGTAEPELVSFVGSMDWLPNVDGVEFLMGSIWPRVREARPHARLQIVGRNPTAEIRRYHGAAGVEVTGGVEDVRPYYAKSAVVVVPLRIGGGTRIKIYEAMAMAKPVVSTTLGAEGLSFVDGEQIEIADRPDLFANHIIDLLSDGERRKRMGEAARTHVSANFSAGVVARQFEQICLATARKSDSSAEKDVGTRTRLETCAAGRAED